MASVSVLPKIFRWVFTVFAALAALAAVAICILMVVNPHLPPGAHFGPIAADVGGQPGTLVIRPANGDVDLMATVFRGTITLFVGKAGGLIEILKHYGLPLVLVDLLFFAGLFELLRRLFRNVGRGDSFSRHTVLLVQIVGGLLIVFSFVSSFAEGLFTHAVFVYFAEHAVITISGAPIHLPVPDYVMLPRGSGFPFGSPLFFSGLLVLALSEVFRQGLALKSENELTI
ncbi:MAG: DUF2975 domain-containing protein [Rhizomicrobium sp.]